MRYRDGWLKSSFYDVFVQYSREKITAIFMTKDEEQHKQIKSPVAHLYNMSATVGREGVVDETLAVLCREIDERFVAGDGGKETGKGKGEVFDMADWCQYFAFDAMGAMTIGKRYGFLEAGAGEGEEDIEKKLVLKQLGDAAFVLGPVGLTFLVSPMICAVMSENKIECKLTDDGSGLKSPGSTSCCTTTASAPG